MRALTFDYDRHAIRDREMPEPRKTHDGQVLCRVRQVGVCGTDRDLAEFKFGYGPEPDRFLIPGHEAVCEVVDGSGLLRTGELVVPTVRRACQPPCRMCARGRADLCLTMRYTERGIMGAHGYATEFTVDESKDLLRIPEAAAEHAVLLEPLSVVEKAVDRALRLHAGLPETALVLGAGTIGLLTAAVLALRGLETTVMSVEDSRSERARLVQVAGADYCLKTDKHYDVVIEAAGAEGAVHAGLKALAPVGVLIVLGARATQREVPLIDLILGNRIVAGSVNASPEGWRRAIAELPLFPRDLLAGVVEFAPMSELARNLTGPAPRKPKLVHVA